MRLANRILSIILIACGSKIIGFETNNKIGLGVFFVVLAIIVGSDNG